MGKYIDADRLKVEIKHLKIDVYDEANQFDIGARSSLTFLESFIVSLQQEQPEVDLEEYVKRWKNKHGVVGMDDLWLKFARHFWNKGYNARKED